MLKYILAGVVLVSCSSLAGAEETESTRDAQANRAIESLEPVCELAMRDPEGIAAGIRRKVSDPEIAREMLMGCAMYARGYLRARGVRVAATSR